MHCTFCKKYKNFAILNEYINLISKQNNTIKIDEIDDHNLFYKIF